MRFNQCLVIVALVLVGCATNPELEGGDTLASAALAATPTAADAEPQASAAVTPDLVVDVNDLAARAAAPIICRDMLKPNSNVIVRQCLTAADWKRYRTVEAQKAAQIVRMMQGGGYR
jgi:hypothetical protein